MTARIARDDLSIGREDFGLFGQAFGDEASNLLLALSALLSSLL
jgi:hypothetical protein